MAEGAKDWSERLMDAVRGDTKSGLITKETTDLQHTIIWAASHLASLVTIPSMADNQEWQLNVLCFLFTHGYFSVNHKITVDNKVCDVLSICFIFGLATVGN